MKKIGQHAVVLGASMAGLTAARVLADRFERVTVVERDTLVDTPEPRKGVPQGRHVHGLLAAGAHVIEELLPGVSDALRADGAQDLDLAADWSWYHFGAYKARFASGVFALVQSRPLLELHVRRRVFALPNVTGRDGLDVVGLLSGDAGRRVAGVTVRRRDDGAFETLHADLVVDATGRGSRTPAWLEMLGYRGPEEETVRIDVGYTSRVYRRRPDDLPGAKMVFVNPCPPKERRMGAVVPVEGDRWIISLCGWLGDHAPTDEAGFLEFARSLPRPDVARVLERVEPLGEIVSHKFQSNQRRRYEKLRALPDGLVVVGDAVCSFNPVYGQGMTVGALGAIELGRSLDKGGLPGLPQRFFKKLAKIVDTPWGFTAGEDLRYPEVEGTRTSAMKFLHWYAGRLHRASSEDSEVFRTFLNVMNMTRPATDLFHPRVAMRVLAP